MSSKLESDVCYHVAPCGECYGGNRRPGAESNGSLYRRVDGLVTCGLTVCTPGSAVGPTSMSITFFNTNYLRSILFV